MTSVRTRWRRVALQMTPSPALLKRQGFAHQGAADLDLWTQGELWTRVSIDGTAEAWLLTEGAAYRASDWQASQ